MALAQRARLRNAGSGSAPRGVRACTVASATSMPAIACVTLSIAPAQPLEPLLDLFFEALLGRLIEARLVDFVGQIRLAGDVAAFVVGRVLVALTVAFFAHQARDCVPELLRDRQ